MQNIIPEVVSSAGEGEEERLGLSYGQLTAVLTNAVQEQQGQIEADSQRIEALETENAELRSLIEQMNERLTAQEQRLAKLER